MTFEEKIRQAILDEANKLAVRHQLYHNNVQLNHKRELRRISPAPAKEIKTPASWNTDKKFNPFYVIKHVKPIARAISRSLLNGTYTPRTPIEQEIPKIGGGVRTVRSQQIPDAAVSNFFYRNLLNKNKHRFSSFSYAYRHDRNVQFAIQDISIDLRYHDRLFIAEFDFSKFFDSISHEYLLNQLRENGFLASALEIKVIEAFINRGSSDRGIPQGTSISLFLANLACWRLDKSLEGLGVRFARYADDTVIWSTDYTKICRSVEIIHEFSSVTGVAINFAKSNGINLLTRDDMPSEFPPKKSFDFLGYTLSVGKVSVKERAISKMKKQMSFILYKNLIQPLIHSDRVPLQLPENDKDQALLVAVSQLRRYLYGNLSEIQLRRYESGASSGLSFKGIMSFYPLIDDVDQLKRLDSWLAASLALTLKKRKKLLIARGNDPSPHFPYYVPTELIVAQMRTKLVDDQPLLAVPSFLRIYRVMRKGLVERGIEGIVNPDADPYHYEDR